LNPDFQMNSAVKILIVEDEIIVAADIARRLSKLNYTVCGIADSASKALNMVESLRPDVVLMDIQIKGDVDGVETALRIRNDFSIPVIFTTAHSDEATLHRARITEPYGYVVKPYQERDLQIAIEMGVYKHKAEKERTDLIAELQQALAQIKTLSGLLPICSSCKKIRDDQGYWEKVELYITKNTEATFTHGYCPDCYHSVREASGLPPKDYPNAGKK